MSDNKALSVVDAIKRLLHINDATAAALMPTGEHGAAHYVGGYIQPDEDDSIRAQIALEDEGWTTIGR